GALVGAEVGAVTDGAIGEQLVGDEHTATGQGRTVSIHARNGEDAVDGAFSTHEEEIEGGVHTGLAPKGPVGGVGIDIVFSAGVQTGVKAVPVKAAVIVNDGSGRNDRSGDPDRICGIGAAESGRGQKGCDGHFLERVHI